MDTMTKEEVKNLIDTLIPADESAVITGENINTVLNAIIEII
jgi:hypothetical protein